MEKIFLSEFPSMPDSFRMVFDKEKVSASQVGDTVFVGGEPYSITTIEHSANTVSLTLTIVPEERRIKPPTSSKSGSYQYRKVTSA